MVLDIEQAQRRDIDTTLNDRLTLAIDEENIADNPYIFEPTVFQGNNWFKQGNNIVKLSLAEQDSIVFLSAPLDTLVQKDITNIIVSFDYDISNVSGNYPVLSNVSLTCMEMTNYFLVENILTTQGHIDVDCSLFNFSSNVVNTAISEQGFKVGINFNGNKSNATIKLSNVQIQFKYRNKLLQQSDSVINRLEPYVDFYRDEDGDLVLQIGGDASGKGIDHSGGDIDTYSKTEIDNKLATKVNVEIGKGLSSNDYTLTEKTKLASVETNANYYVHPSTHQTDIITESSALTNLETSANVTQHDINVAIDGLINESGIAYGKVDATSTATVFTATVVGVSELKDGTSVMLRNGVITSASGWTLNVNNLGAKPVYSNMADATRETTTFNINYTILFIYDENRVDGGCWIYYRGYYSDANSVGYQLRTNSSKFKALDKGYRYRIWLEVSDGEFMPVNTSNSTNATANRSAYMNTREFLIDGRVLYNAYNGTTDVNALLSATTMWQQYAFTLGYSFNNTGSALNLTVDAPLYMVAEPTSNGKARLHTPYYTQTLPSQEDGLIYIYLGQMYSATNIELAYEHRVYEYKNNGIREYRKTNIDDYDVTFTYSFGLGGIDDTITIHTSLIERSD